MTDAPLQRLIQLRETLNEHIDAYLAAYPELDTRKAQVVKIEEEIGKIALQIHDEVVPVATQILSLAMQPTISVAIRIAIDLDIFNLVKEKNITLDELTTTTGADRSLLCQCSLKRIIDKTDEEVVRVLRLLTATNILHATGIYTYTSTTLSDALVVPFARDAIKVHFDSVNPHYFAIPAYLAANGYKEPTLDSNALLNQHGVNFWELLGRKPEKLKDFESAMSINDSLPPEMKPKFPFVDVARSMADNDSVFLVDAGGGHGAFLKELVTQHTELQEKNIVLQDLPAVIANVDETLLPKNVEVMAHDATLTPQPIFNARIYLFRRVFHGLVDTEVVKALKGLQSAFAKGHSKLLIYEQVMPDEGCTALEAVIDINVMVLCAKERSEKQWKKLLEEAGFEIKKIWRAEIGNFDIIEADMV